MTELTAKQEQAALLLAYGKTRTEVAEQVHVSPQTVTRWKRESEEFRQRMQDHLQEVLSELQPKALSVLSELLENDNPWVQISAARDILTRGKTESTKDNGQTTIKIIGMPELGSPSASDDE